MKKETNEHLHYAIQSGGDFLKHQFDVILVRYDKNLNAHDHIGTSRLTLEDKLLGKRPIDGQTYMSRAVSVSVPQMISQTYDIRSGFSTIKKIGTKVVYERKSEITFLMDEPLYVLDELNAFSNNGRSLLDFDLSPDPVQKKLTPLTINSLLKGGKSRIDLIVKHNDLLSKSIDEKSFQPLWLFEDIIFLGQKDDLIFARENADTQQIAFTFLFKRCTAIRNDVASKTV